MPYMQMQI